ncbi:nicotinamide-nucleotide amidase [Meinhardsimonia xiamenensis]|jgi:nicotinamide-nucleotide amidase|uniref:Nicotinamide-nucleotide amidase n=1 Tax=Meinhardsimonia xiamenensis TaxID=990712 RepID=A0A1G9FJU8_9RHOB|nr:CinA family protein [Meinhardsimonia xiamenensis]PRX37810.1 nicotinamide-nucleotide amidase [Meinhardsimonia xiamenensis]SDK88654.1 nicotinamide-nucleotide amidase [Meinhardsimonia xiamenensis]
MNAPRIAAILELARARSAMIATAESCTGGMVAVALTELPGSSDVFERGFVTYSNDAKIELLGVRADTLAAHGAVSEEVAAEMVAGALTRSRAALAVSITGIAGPGGSEHKPEGRVCFGLMWREAAPVTQTVEFGALGRASVRAAARDHALALLLAALS